MSDSMMAKKELLKQYKINTESINSKFYLIRQDKGCEIKILYSFSTFLELTKWKLVVDALDSFTKALKDGVNLVYVEKNNKTTELVKLKDVSKPVNYTKPSNSTRPRIETPKRFPVVIEVNYDKQKRNIRNILEKKGLLPNI